MSTAILATLFFACAIVHTFCVQGFIRLSKRFAPGSWPEKGLHVLGEVEVVFGVWALFFLILKLGLEGWSVTSQYLWGLSFMEPAFVLVIMTVCSTRPILNLAEKLISVVAQILPLSPAVSFYAVTLTVGPLLGSLITEPAAMTVTALLLLKRFFTDQFSLKFKYATLALLFVNISVGGTLTPFAAPPVLMVASVWQWDAAFMLEHFAWKAALACAISTALVTAAFYRSLAQSSTVVPKTQKTPVWIALGQLILLALIVASAHHALILAAVFVLFLGFFKLTSSHQGKLNWREGALVAFFLTGIVILGPPQRWWLEPILLKLNSFPLYLSAISLTAITDNAALTFLGAQVPSLSEASRYALVAGAVVGGGLTVIANAPNPAGFGILNPAFGERGIDPFRLFLSALLPTFISALCFWLF